MNEDTNKKVHWIDTTFKTLLKRLLDIKLSPRYIFLKKILKWVILRLQPISYSFHNYLKQQTVTKLTIIHSMTHNQLYQIVVIMGVELIVVLNFYFPKVCPRSYLSELSFSQETIQYIWKKKKKKLR